ncbi:MAG: hypothetical protein ABMB14_20130 [Myxococcota bacterium]
MIPSTAVRSVAALLLSGLAGCAYKVTLTAEPTPTEIVLPDNLPDRLVVNGDRVVTPADVTLRWVPFGHQRVVVSAPGYRTLEVDLRREEIRWSRFLIGTLAHPATLSGRPRGEVRFVLVPDHGPAGTWTPDQID